MTINYIPNDPRAGSAAPGIQKKSPRPDRPAAKAGFTLSNVQPEGEHQPETPEFLFWQCREAALAAIEAFESSAEPHGRWQGNRKKLQLLQDVGIDVNAFYDRESFSFFHATAGRSLVFSGMSTDVVAHEVGHGLLDSIKPELWDATILEAGAFHEAFGDCIALVTALEDKETRTALLAVTSNLRKRNFVESTAEDLSDAIRRVQPSHNAAEPRRAFNTHKFQLPETLPLDGGPGKLINEVHSFGMVFTGCFWNLIANIFAASANKNEAALRAASGLAGSLLIAGAKAAPVVPRFFQSVGRAMILGDEAAHGGANRDHIRNAFQDHNVMLGTNAMLAPTAALAGSAPKAAALGAAAKKDLKRQLGGYRGARLTVSKAEMFGRNLVSAVQKRNVDLSSVHKSLKGVVAEVAEPVMVGASGHRAAVIGALPHGDNTDAEVRNFVKSLVEHGNIADGTTRTPSRSVAAVSMRSTPSNTVTHVVRRVGGKKMLTRIRFSCGCGCCTK